MGVDMVVMVEVRHAHEDEWHPLRGVDLAYEAPRNNVMFSMLADVGNRSGMWEPRWQEPRHVVMDDGDELDVPGWWYDPDDGGHDRIIPIDGPRGIPDDASMAWRANVAIWEAQREMVATSYLTPREILAGNWDQNIIRTGIVTEEDYLLYRDTGKVPERWAGEAGGKGNRTVTRDEYEAGIRGEHNTAVMLTWPAGTAREICADFLDMIEDLASTTEEYGTSQLRFMVLFEC